MTSPRSSDRPVPPVKVTLAALADVRRALDEAEGRECVGALPYLREAADHLTQVIDEAMATAVLTGQTSLRGAGASAGYTENAVGPRLGRTRSLAAYADERGRVTASGIERAKYDLETGKTRQPATPLTPMRFQPRRPS